MSLRTLSLDKNSSTLKGSLTSKNSNKASGALAGLHMGRVVRRISMDIDALKATKLEFFSSSRTNSKESLLQTPRSACIKNGDLNALSNRLQVSPFLMEKNTRIRWKDIKTPLSPPEVLEKFIDYLSAWEQEEIMNYPSIYYIGKNFKPKNPVFDDIEGNYKILIKDHIAFRYQIIGIIGSGTFGQVIEVFDHCNNKSLALKIIKSKSIFSKQAKIEIEILEHIKEVDRAKESNIIEILDKFEFRGHTVIFT